MTAELNLMSKQTCFVIFPLHSQTSTSSTQICTYHALNISWLKSIIIGVKGRVAYSLTGLTQPTQNMVVKKIDRCEERCQFYREGPYSLHELYHLSPRCWVSTPIGLSLCQQEALEE